MFRYESPQRGRSRQVCASTVWESASDTIFTPLPTAESFYVKECDTVYIYTVYCMCFFGGCFLVVFLFVYFSFFSLNVYMFAVSSIRSGDFRSVACERRSGAALDGLESHTSAWAGRNCMHICAHPQAHECTHARAHASTYARTHSRKHACTHHTHARTHARTYPTRTHASHIFTSTIHTHTSTLAHAFAHSCCVCEYVSEIDIAKMLRICFSVI